MWSQELARGREAFWAEGKPLGELDWLDHWSQVQLCCWSFGVRAQEVKPPPLWNGAHEACFTALVSGL